MKNALSSRSPPMCHGYIGIFEPMDQEKATFDYKANLIQLARQLGLGAEDIEFISSKSNDECKSIVVAIQLQLDSMGLKSRKVTPHPEVKF